MSSRSLVLCLMILLWIIFAFFRSFPWGLWLAWALKCSRDFPLPTLILFLACIPLVRRWLLDKSKFGVFEQRGCWTDCFFFFQRDDAWPCNKKVSWWNDAMYPIVTLKIIFCRISTLFISLKNAASGHMEAATEEMLCLERSALRCALHQSSHVMKAGSRSTW